MTEQQSASVRERPIIFSAPMVRAILDGRKTQTRRIVSPANGIVDGHASGKRAWDGPDGCPLDLLNPDVFADGGPSPAGNPGPYLHVPRKGADTRHRVYPIWQRGDRLWVRESGVWVDVGFERSVAYRADGEPDATWTRPLRWKPPIHMPRWASRITLEITDVRVQRLQEISEADAWAEGCIRGMPDDVGGFFPAEEKCRVGMRGWGCARDWYADLWEEIHGEESWDANPWLWTIGFKRIPNPTNNTTSDR